jgi:hypothetical protein
MDSFLQNLLDHLRVNVEKYVPQENPYSHQGMGGPWDDKELQYAFARASVIEVATVDNPRNLSSFAMSFPNSLAGGGAAFPKNLSTAGEIWTLKVAKAGSLNRKDDFLEGGKKTISRKWKAWSVVLTGSQLLLFRDPAWVSNLLAQPQTEDGHFIFPEASVFKPDELLSVRDAVAVFDNSYTKVRSDPVGG